MFNPADFEPAEDEGFDEEGEAALDELEGIVRPPKRQRPSSGSSTTTPVIDLDNEAAQEFVIDLDEEPAAPPPKRAYAPAPYRPPQPAGYSRLGRDVNWEEEAEMRRLEGLPPPDPLLNPVEPPEVERSTSSGVCHTCGQPGHWARDCPTKPVDPNEPPPMPCPCGAGMCSILTAHTEKNSGRRFYRCPNRDTGCGFFQWSDEPPRQQAAMGGGGGHAAPPAGGSYRGGWDEDEDGKWEPPMIDNPAMTSFNEISSSLFGYRFAYTVTTEVLEHLKSKAGGLYLFRSPKFVSAEHGDRPRERFPSTTLSESAVGNWLAAKAQPLVGLYSSATKARYKGAVLVIFMNIDFERNTKSIQYVLKRARKAAAGLKGKLSIALSATANLAYEMDDFGLTSEKLNTDILMGIAADGKHYGSEVRSFSGPALAEFARAFQAGELTPYVKPDPPDEPDQSGDEGMGYDEDDDDDEMEGHDDDLKDEA